MELLTIPIQDSFKLEDQKCCQYKFEYLYEISNLILGSFENETYYPILAVIITIQVLFYFVILSTYI